MIIGGANGAGQAGGMRAGYSERFLLCSASIASQALKDAIAQTARRAIIYSASAKIRNIADNAWVDLGSVSAFETSNKAVGELGTASITLSDAQTWSAYRVGGTYEGLLAPSNRRLQLFCGLNISGTNYETILFEGIIKEYGETLTPNGGSINLTLEDMRDVSRREPAVTGPTEPFTLYRLLYSQICQSPWASRSIRGIAHGIQDIESDTGDLPSGFPPMITMGLILDSRLVSTEITVSKSLRYIQDKDLDSTNNTPVFVYTDRNIKQAQRSVNAQSWNVYRIYYHVGGIGTTGEVKDDADIVKRGRLVYPAGYVGTPTIGYDEVVEIATQALNAGLRGKTNLEIDFNPFIKIGTVIQVSSTRFSIAQGVAKVMNYSHSFSAGSAKTTISELALQ